MTSWMAVLRLLGTLAVVASAARAFVAFAAWRKAFVNRLIGADPNPHELPVTSRAEEDHRRKSSCRQPETEATKIDRLRMCLRAAGDPMQPLWRTTCQLSSTAILPELGTSK